MGTSEGKGSPAESVHCRHHAWRINACDTFVPPRREKFGGLVDLVPVAERVDKLHARCGVCGAKAAFTLRTVQEDAVCVIGGTETYMPVCRKHYLVGRTAVQIADDALKGSESKASEEVRPSDPAGGK